MLDSLLSPIIQILMLFFTALITWFFSRSRYKMDLKSSGIDNEIKSADYYRSLLDDMALRLDNAISELMKLEDRFVKLMQTNRELSNTNMQLMETNKELLVELKKYKQLNGKKE